MRSNLLIRRGACAVEDAQDIFLSNSPFKDHNAYEALAIDVDNSYNPIKSYSD
jgi:hypothetical protein